MSFWRFWLRLVIFNSFGLAVMALNISYTVPTQCDALTVSWIGGQPPFRLMVISVSHAPDQEEGSFPDVFLGIECRVFIRHSRKCFQCYERLMVFHVSSHRCTRRENDHSCI